MVMEKLDENARTMAELKTMLKDTQKQLGNMTCNGDNQKHSLDAMLELGVKFAHLNASVQHVHSDVKVLQTTANSIHGHVKPVEPVPFYPLVCVAFQLMYLMIRVNLRLKYEGPNWIVGISIWGIIPSVSYFAVEPVNNLLIPFIPTSFVYASSIAVWCLAAYWGIWFTGKLESTIDAAREKLKSCTRIKREQNEPVVAAAPAAAAPVAAIAAPPSVDTEELVRRVTDETMRRIAAPPVRYIAAPSAPSVAVLEEEMPVVTYEAQRRDERADAMLRRLKATPFADPCKQMSSSNKTAPVYRLKV